MLQEIRFTIQHFLTLNKSERRGLLSLIFLILFFSGAYFLLPHLKETGKKDFREFEKEIYAFRVEQQKFQDSAYITRLQNSGKIDRDLALKKIKPFPFDPNKLPEEKWAALGLTQKQIRSIKNYEAKGGQFRSKEDLKKMYAISTVEYEILEPYICTKPSSETTNNKQHGRKKQDSHFALVEINVADSAMLVKCLKIAPWLAARVIKYRTLLGGFYQKNQLQEVYGFDSIAVAKRSPVIRVDTSLIHKLNLNKATFKQLVRHPYISYQLTQYIVNTRNARGKYKSVEEIKKLPQVSESLFYKLEPYLSVKD